MKIILASGSERRRHLLSWLDISFEVVVSRFDEESIEESDPEKLVKKLALEKARAVAKKLKATRNKLQEILVIGADTIVVVDEQIIGKPKDEQDAVKILKKLSGKKHTVFTGVAVINTGTGKSLVDYQETKVTFRKLSNREIRDYVETGEPMDKGGAYAIQLGAKGFVRKVEGSYTNVVGLPLVLLGEMLEKQGFEIEMDVSKIVFEKTGYRS